GVMPLPPYITAPLENPERYQTVYSAATGSAAAPTAGLHWTPALIERVQALGVTWATVTLHGGLDTFRPVQTDNVLDHTMHSEWYDLPAATAAAINQARASGGRVIAVGTTSVRVLETVGRNQQSAEIVPEAGWTDIFIYPP
ncbi:S-adenosylmethionine:tRNA ribosyltransferase-isomerase, partial [Bradyrhizobium sp. NBAIM08]|uniref:S-adenosylmethionine:tRNA ribosyltransferase-isomerase n=1 Tax=Bradyrhizobium sp. NBAIM08 TaxID=2793815 RepID=UPI001CD1EBB0